ESALDEDVLWASNPLHADHAAIKRESDQSQWGPNALAQKCEQEKLPGVCNALSAAYLGGMISPTEGRLGVSETNFAFIKKLKGSLDERQEREKKPSSAVTMAFAGERLSARAAKAGAPVAAGALAPEHAMELSERHADMTPEKLTAHVGDAL